MLRLNRPDSSNSSGLSFAAGGAGSNIVICRCLPKVEGCFTFGLCGVKKHGYRLFTSCTLLKKGCSEWASGLSLAAEQSIGWNQKARSGRLDKVDFVDSSQCFVQQQGKAHLPTLNMPLSTKSTLYNRPIHAFWLRLMLCPKARESPLAHSEHPFFKRVQLVKRPYPYFLTPCQCFVQHQGKAHLPTLNMPEQSPPCPNAHSLLFDSSQCFVQQQGKAHLPTLNIPSSKECNL